MLKRLLRRNIIVSTLVRLRKVLPARFHKRALLSIGLLLFNSILELAGLGVLVPLFLTIVKEDALKEGFLASVYEWTGLASEAQFISFLCLAILVLIVVKNITSIWIQRYMSRFCFGVFSHTSAELQETFYQKGFLYFKENNSNDIVRDISNATYHFSHSLMLPMLNFLTELAIILLIVAGFLWYDPKIILLLAVLVFPIFFVFYRLVRKKIASIAEDVHRLYAVTSKNLFQSIFGYVDVSINNNEEWFFSEFRKNISRMAEQRVRQYVYNLMPTKVIETSMIFAILVIICYGLFVLKDREALLLLLGAFTLGAYRIMPSINRLMLSLINIRSFQYTFDVVSQTQEKRDLSIENDPLSFNSSIQLDRLAYKYPLGEKNVLHHIDLEIAHGETVGIIGRSGSGKTTLVNLLLGLIKPTDGRIQIDGKELNEKTLRSWRHLVGYVQQEVFLVDGTLAENIALGFDEVDEEKVLQVASRASLDEVIAELPKGIHTHVGERGAKISGGQRQRVGIARALYSGAQVLFFDEATSALDSTTEMEITEAINSLNSGDLTMIIIAHRHSTLKYCNRIIELEEGRVLDNVQLPQ